MYTSHFGLRLLPFENVPDPAFFFNEGEYQRVLDRLTSAVVSGRGLMVLAGPIGSGKTTLSQKLMADLPEGTVQLWLAEPPGSDRELFQAVLHQLGAAFTWESRVLALGVLRERLLKLHAAGGHCLIVVDESHKFDDEGLEAIRLLNNLEQGATKLIQVLMLGQEELTEMLTRAGREAFRQRIANLEVLGRMTPPQVRAYVLHRLRVAGGEPLIFPDLLLDAIAEAGGGIPRLTNSLCDRALLHAFECRKSAIDSKDLLHGAEEVGVYRKAFHFLVGRERTAAEQPAVAIPPVTVLDPSQAQPVAPVPASVTVAPVAPVTPVEPAEPVAPIEPGSWAGISPQSAAEPQNLPPSRNFAPLALLAGGVAALAASIVYYGTKASAVYGDDWLTALIQSVIR